MGLRALKVLAQLAHLGLQLTGRGLPQLHRLCQALQRPSAVQLTSAADHDADAAVLHVWRAKQSKGSWRACVEAPRADSAPSTCQVVSCDTLQACWQARQACAWATPV